MSAPQKPFADMLPSAWSRIVALPPRIRDRVVERCAMKWADGMPPARADAEALAEEMDQRTLPGATP